MGASQTFFFFFFSLSLFLALYITTTTAAAIATALPTTTTTTTTNPSSNTDFIRTSCTSTLYPDLCFSSLSRYAASVRSDPVRLAQAAAKDAAAKIRAAFVRASMHLKKGSVGREAAALRDCVDTLGDAADRTRQSAAEIARLPGGPDLAWRVSNAQTWMSGAITSEVTCADGFDAVKGGAAKADVVAQVGRARQHSSNALALVNKLVRGP